MERLGRSSQPPSALLYGREWKSSRASMAVLAGIQSRVFYRSVASSKHEPGILDSGMLIGLLGSIHSSAPGVQAPSASRKASVNWDACGASAFFLRREYSPGNAHTAHTDR